MEKSVVLTVIIKNIFNLYLTSNEWFPLDETGYTKEHVQMVKERQARYANQFIKQNRGY